MTVLYKLGGSLLTLPGLCDRIRTALQLRSSKNCLIVTGGGASADVVRDWSRIHELSDEAAHWIAISSLDFNRQLLQRLLKLESVSSRETAHQIWSKSNAPLLLDMTRFATEEESRMDVNFLTAENESNSFDQSNERSKMPSGISTIERRSLDRDLLPHNWNVTSDSLAAWTSKRWPCDELILLKSVPIPLGLSAAEASGKQLVDQYFPRLANCISCISWCNLRDSQVVVQPWLTNGHRCV